MADILAKAERLAQAEWVAIEADADLLAFVEANGGIEEVRRRLRAMYHPRRPRTEITEAMREKAVSLFRTGKRAAEVARIVGISVPSANNIKRIAGLTQRIRRRN